MKYKNAISVNYIKPLLVSVLLLSSLSAFAGKKITGGIIGCEVNMYQPLGGTPITDTILRLRNFNNATTITITRLVSYTATGRPVYDTADRNKFPYNFNKTMAPNTSTIIPFSMLTSDRVDPHLNAAQVLFYWVPSNANASIGLKIGAVTRTRNNYVNTNNATHCHVVADKEVPVVQTTEQTPRPEPAPKTDP